jgi:hypothetical protein
MVLACGGFPDVGGGGGAEGQAAPAAAVDPAYNVRFTLWKCGNDKVEFFDVGSCKSHTVSWGCTWSQTGDKVIVDWKPHEGSAYAPQHWDLSFIEPGKMGGTMAFGGDSKPMRCDRKE